jgi:hypothetical protein
MQHEVYLKEAPWICLTYLTTDAEADAAGTGRARFDCCICGAVQEVEFVLPAVDDPVWATVDPQKGLPEAYRLRTLFLSDHTHEGMHSNPMMEWALPLRNPAALKGGVDLGALRDRVMREIGKQ